MKSIASNVKQRVVKSYRKGFHSTDDIGANRQESF